MAEHSFGERLARTGKKGGDRIRLFFLSSGFDMPFLIILMVILGIGLVTMYSASYAYAFYYQGNSSFYIAKQLIAAAVGVAAMFGLSMVDYHIFAKLWWLIYGVTVAMLVAVFLVPNESGIHRWLPLPIFGQFQPSEIAKFAVVITMSRLIAVNYKRMDRFGVNMAVLAPAVFLCGLIIVEPHVSGTILIVLIAGVLLLVGGIRWRYVGILVGAAVLLIAAFFLLKGYESDRFAVWQHPMEVFTSDELYDGMTGRDAAWQTVQSLFAIGSGGLMGSGLGNSRQKHLFLPEPQNDFIFAVFCEELGFIGAIVVIALFAVLVWRGIVIGLRAKDKFGSLVAIGLSAQIGAQVALNIAVVSNLIPNTGISLPFFSYGGTSLAVLLAQMGVILSISRQSSLAAKHS